MKKRITDNNGFPKVSGLIIMVLLVGLFCFASCFVAGTNHAEENPPVYTQASDQDLF